jgi:hypothetical protein
MIDTPQQRFETRKKEWGTGYFPAVILTCSCGEITDSQSFPVTCWNCGQVVHLGGWLIMED